MADRVKEIAEKLGITADEARELLEDDKRVDRMTMKELSEDLTAEQKKTIKSMSQADRKPTAYKFKTRERKADTDKRELIARLTGAVEDCGVEVVNPEREFLFTYNGKKYKVVLSAPRT